MKNILMIMALISISACTYADADEWPDSALWGAVAKLMKEDPPDTVGAEVHRQLMVHGMPLNFVCQPERRLRLVRPEHSSVAGSCGDQAEGIHDRIQVEGKTIRLPGKLMHAAFEEEEPYKYELYLV